MLLLLAILPLSSCSVSESKEEEQLKVGMVVGGIFDQYIPNVFPDADIEYFYSANDLPLALQTKKIDIYVDDEYSAKEHCKIYPSQRIDSIIHDDYYGFIFNQNKIELRDKFNFFLDEIRSDGRLAQIENTWLNSTDEANKIINYNELTGDNGTIKVGITATMQPFDYVKNGVYVGYEPALFFEFCKEYGYNVEFQNADFSSNMTSVTSGRCDIGMASYSITEERKKTMLFSDPIMVANCVAVVRNEDDIDIAGIDVQNVISKIGVVSGGLFDVAVREDDPKADIEYYNYTTDLPLALNSNKIDGYAVDEPVARLLCNTYEGHVIIKKLTVERYGIVVNKNKPELQKKFNEYLATLKKSGELAKLQETWMGTDESIKTIDFDSIKENTEVLKLATTSTMQPFDYMKDNQYAGYEIALIASFCKEYGYGLQIEDSTFPSVIASVSAGKADFGSCVITITDERKETMNFTDPIFEGGIVLVEKDKSNSFESLNGTNIGIQSGSTYDRFLYDSIENPNVEYFYTITDMKAALDSNKISGFVIDTPIAELFINENNNSYKILDSLHEVEYGYALPKNRENNEQLKRELENYISRLKQNGKLTEIYNIWTGDDNSKKVIDYDGLPNNGRIIEVALCSSVGAPFVYTENHQILGYEVDLLYHFCKEYGYRLNIVDYNLDGLFTAIATGKCDIGLGGISISEERKESMDFVDEQIAGGCVVVVKNEATSLNNKTNKNSILESFYKTFIREDRWKLFLSGIVTTMAITALSIIIGTLLGFGIYMLYRNVGVGGQRIILFIRNVLLKTPTVVILMIIYYIIFGKSNINGIAVSILGLSLLFSNAVMGLLIMGVNSIDKGQLEAAYMLGYSKNKAFIEIVLPQAILAVLSGYKSEIITLIKDSAVVGYIAVQDLTKVSDVIRSRTYEAFFPLIATAIIYYVIATIFIHFLSKFEFRIDPKKRKEIPILKGVVRNDKN